MKKKYFTKGSFSQEVKVGDRMYVDGDSYTATEKILDWLVSQNLLAVKVSPDPEVANKEVVNVPESAGLYKYVEKLAERFNWKPAKMDNYLETLYNMYPILSFSLLLREIAIDLDKKYQDHISSCDEVFTISPLNGKITKVFSATVKNFRNFAAFRNIEDAKIACKILKPFLKEMYSGSGK